MAVADRQVLSRGNTCKTCEDPHLRLRTAMPTPLATVAVLFAFSLAPANWVMARESRADFNEGDRGAFRNRCSGVSIGIANLFYYTGCDACGEAWWYFFDSDGAGGLDDDDRTPLAPTTVTVVGMGLGRTGSTSLAMAFETLGYHPYHDDELEEVRMPGHGEYEGGCEGGAGARRGAGSTNPPDDEDDVTEEQWACRWIEHFDRVGAAGYDVSFRASLTAALERGAKVILTVRDDADAYARSWVNGPMYFATAMHRAPFKWMPRVQAMYPWIEDEFYDEPTRKHGHPARPDQHLNQTFLAEVYLDHMAFIKATVPPGRLLVFNVKEGWAPLCEFMGRPIPVDSEGRVLAFPRINSSARQAGKNSVYWAVMWFWWAGPAAVAGVLWWCVRACGQPRRLSPACLPSRRSHGCMCSARSAAAPR